MATETYREYQHPRDGDGRWSKKPWEQPGKHRARARAQIAAGGAFLAVGVLELLTSLTNLLTALMTVLTVSLMAWAGVIGKRKAKSVRRKAVRRSIARMTPGRSASPAMAKAKTDRILRKREQRWQRRDEVWSRRRSSAGSWVRGLFGPTRVTSSDWSQMGEKQ